MIFKLFPLRSVVFSLALHFMAWVSLLIFQEEDPRGTPGQVGFIELSWSGGRDNENRTDLTLGESTEEKTPSAEIDSQAPKERTEKENMKTGPKEVPWPKGRISGRSEDFKSSVQGDLALRLRYPRIALERRQEGLAVFEIAGTSERGLSHHRLIQSTGYPALDHAVDSALRKIQNEGHPVSQIETIEVNFVLQTGETAIHF